MVICWIKTNGHLKGKYFATILKQEQGWFDENNAFEFATKVQAQLEQIELGVGDKFGLCLQMISQLIGGIVVAFTTSWKLALIMLCVSPCIFLSNEIFKKNYDWSQSYL